MEKQGETSIKIMYKCVHGMSKSIGFAAIAMLCCATLCYATLRYAMLRYAMLCYATLCYAMLCSTVQMAMSDVLLPCRGWKCAVAAYHTGASISDFLHIWHPARSI